MLFQQRSILRRGRHPAFQNLHLRHGVQHMRKAGAHLAVDIQRRVEFCVLFQITEGNAVGHAELALVICIFAGQDLQQGRFARAVLADDADAVFPLDTGGDVVQDDLFTEALAQFFQMYQHCCSSNLLLPLPHSAGTYS